MVAHILPAQSYSPTYPWVGSIGLNLTVSQHGHVAYQIKGTHGCSNIGANILPEDPHPPDPGDRDKSLLIYKYLLNNPSPWI